MREPRLGVNRFTARAAGFCYLIVVVTGIFSLAYVPSKLIVNGDLAQTSRNISENQLLLRFGILSSVLCYLAFLILPLILYRLLSHANKTLGMLMVLFAVVSVPISLLNLQSRYAVLSLVNGADFTRILDQSQIYSQLGILLNQYSNGILIAQIFWGLWLLPFGILVYRSGFLPRIFGILLIAGCFGYLVNFTCRTLMMDFGTTALASYITLPAALGEIGICLWLQVRGIALAQTPVRTEKR